MDYKEYTILYEKAVTGGTRQVEDMASEEEWNIVSPATRAQIVARIRKELEDEQKNGNN